MYDGKKERQRESGPGTRKETQIRRRTYEQTRKEKRRRNRGFGIERERERKTRVRVGRGTQKENERVKYSRDDLQLRDRERERERRGEWTTWSIPACAYIRRSEHPLYFILPPREIPADSYSLERNKRWPSFSLSPRSEERSSSQRNFHLAYYSTPLAYSPRTSYRGFSFYASHFLLELCFSFLSLAPVRLVLPFFLSFFLSFPFLLLLDQTPTMGLCNA